MVQTLKAKYHVHVYKYILGTSLDWFMFGLVLHFNTRSLKTLFELFHLCI